MALESVFVTCCYDKRVAGHVYDHFDWPVIQRGHQDGVTGSFCYRFKGTINYVSADIVEPQFMVTPVSHPAIMVTLGQSQMISTVKDVTLNRSPHYSGIRSVTQCKTSRLLAD